MKSPKHWRELAEYASLGFSALGTMAAAATQQTLYAATPLTIALSLNLLNRQELTKRTRQIGNNITQLDRQFSSNLRSLSNQIQSVEDSLNALPPSLKVADLSELEGVNQKSQQEIVQLRKQLNSLEISFRNIPAQKEPIDFDSIETALTHLKEQFNALTEQLNVLKLRLDNLPAPPESIDLTEIEQAIAAIKSQLTSEIGELKRQVQLLNQIGEIQQHLEDLDVSMAALHDNTNHIERELENQKTQQLLIVPQHLEALEVVATQLQNKTKGLDARTNHLKSQLKKLEILATQSVKFEDLEQELTRLSEQFTGQIDVNIEKQIETFNQLIKEIRPAYEYELVFDRKGSREVLLKALKTAKERLILVCPWMTFHGADDEVMGLCRKFLNKGGILKIGWGHLSDTSLNRHEPMTEDNFLREVAASKKYLNRVKPGKNAEFWYKQKLNEFKQLQQEYPSQINLRLLGTHEKFLVCDDFLAMLGSHNFLTSSDKSTERELGLRTNAPHIIKELIERFENTPDLEAENDESDDDDNFEENSYDDSYYKPMAQEEYYSYDVGFENLIDRAERLYGIPDPRLVEDD